jgi:hypothetical protein
LYELLRHIEPPRKTSLDLPVVKKDIDDWYLVPNLAIQAAVDVSDSFYKQRALEAKIRDKYDIIEPKDSGAMCVSNKVDSNCFYIRKERNYSDLIEEKEYLKKYKKAHSESMKNGIFGFWKQEDEFEKTYINILKNIKTQLHICGFSFSNQVQHLEILTHNQKCSSNKIELLFSQLLSIKKAGTLYVEDKKDEAQMFLNKALN